MPQQQNSTKILKGLSGKLQKIVSKELKERAFLFQTPQGLHVTIALKPGFAGKFALFTAPYGSIDLSWKENGKLQHTPAGVAHFLEHQLFKKASGDLSDHFAARGAYCNAQTSHTLTSYYFESVNHFEDNLKLLFEMYFTPYFEPQLVELEKAIIAQELAGYLDHPYWVNYQALLEALYQKHPVNIDIAGDQESIEAITPTMLEHAHASFYHPYHSSLILVGDLDPKKLQKQILNLEEEFCEHRKPPMIQKASCIEPQKVQTRQIKKFMYLATPRLLMGYKDPVHLKGKALIRRTITAEILLDMTFGKSSDFFERLYRKGLISSDFSASYQAEASFAHAIIGGETKAPEELASEILKQIRTLKQGKILSSSLLELKKRKSYGLFLRIFESLEACAFAYQTAWQNNFSLFNYPDVIASIKVQELEELAKELFLPSRCSLSSVHKAGNR